MRRRAFLAAGAALPLAAAGPEPLAAFRAALGRDSPVNVLQFGDSHTANDSFSGRLRELFQSRFGDAGRGFLPPGIPHDWYRPGGVTVTAEGWLRLPGPGLAPFRQQAYGQATMAIRADAPGGCARVAVDALPQSGGGTIDLRFDTGAMFAVPTGSGGPAWAEVSAPGAQSLTVAARGDGPVDLLGIRVLTGRPGVTWSNLGTPGATVAVLSRWDPAVAARDARVLDPSLLVLAFGTNEGFKDGTDLAEYRELFAARLRAMRSLSAGASALVILPPDGVRRGAAGCPGGWGVPPLLPQVRRVQAEVARSAGAAVWDWSAATGGACSVLPLMRTDPPAAAPDGVHLFRPGYRATAERLYGFLTGATG